MAVLNKVGRPKKTKTTQVKLTYGEVKTLLDLIEQRHDRMIVEGYEGDEWGHFAYDAAEEMGRVYMLATKLIEIRKKMQDA